METYLTYSGNDAQARAHEAGQVGFPQGVVESFILHGPDARFPGAPQGSWCIALVDGATPPEGFQEPRAPEASTTPPTPAELSLVAGNAFLTAARLRLLTIGME